jgi:hypothetical protein
VLKLFGLAIFCGAAVMFLLEPLAGKLYLPLLGGGPAVWNTCVLFFQAVLLLGYLYAHVLSRFQPMAQALVHLCVLVAGVAMPPLGAPPDAGRTDMPVLWLSWELLARFGPVFFAVSATGPLLQRWFSRTSHSAAKDPYFLYAASNLGSAVGLLAYPLVVEPLLTRSAQLRWLTGTYAAFGVLAILCVHAVPLRAWRERQVWAGPAASSAPRPAWRTRGLWLVYAAAPASLMLGVTQHITTDVAAVPLLWVIPLTLYLLSYVVAFSRRVRFSSTVWGRMLVVPVLVLIVVMIGKVTQEWLTLPLHLLVFFIGATMCHRRLAETRPDTAHLTEFYLFLSIGGVLGGAFNALVAPNIFSSVLEYPLVLGLVCILRPRAVGEAPGPRLLAARGLAIDLAVAAVIAVAALYLGFEALRGTLGGRWTALIVAGVLPAGIAALTLVRGTRRFGLTCAALLLQSQFVGYSDRAILQRRSFFGVNTVLVSADGTRHTLTHGTTTHGVQFRRTGEPELDRLSRLPISYYHGAGPMGDLVSLLRAEGRFNRIACVGLGTGTMAAHAGPGVEMTFIEIDPVVVEIATDPRCFTYIADARQAGATIRTWVGDGRLGVAALPPASLDLIVLDAFSSDAIPVHLMTREALGVYLERLAPGGIIAFHVSSRTFDLPPVVGAIAREQGVRAFLRIDAIDSYAEAKFASDWVAVVRSEEDLGPLPGLGWQEITAAPGKRAWSDEYTNVLSVIDLKR